MDGTKKQKWIKYYIPSYLYAGLIFSLSSYSLKFPLSAPSSSDKIVHLAEYGMLGLLLARSFYNSDTGFFKKYSIIFAIFTGALCGITDEAYQKLVPNRVFDLLDWCWDMAGILVGSFFYRLMTKKALDTNIKGFFSNKT